VTLRSVIICLRFYPQITRIAQKSQKKKHKSFTLALMLSLFVLFVFVTSVQSV
jgi:hypothetical protein